MKPTAPPMHRQTADILSETQVFQDYESAFKTATGLSLALRAPDENARQKPLPTGGNAFCQLMARDHKACAECLKLQREAAHRSAHAACTLQCFAGLCETNVPVRVGKDTVAFLQTGHLMLHPPDKKAFSKIARTLLNWGAAVDVKKAEHAWLATRVIKPRQYHAFARLLEVFASHLGLIAERLQTSHAATSTTSEIERAKCFIREHSTEDFSLADVARVVNWSAHYFSRRFTQATGLGFTEYVTRVRIELARQMLGNPALRINEVAFATGFQSLSQFNRAFRQVTGKSPREFRQSGSGF